MNINIVEQHSDSCEKTYCSNWGTLFYADGEFYFINIPLCLVKGMHHIDKAEWFISAVRKKCKVKSIYSTKRSWNIDEDFKRMIRQDILLKENSHEVNYTYTNMVGVVYGVVTEKPYMDILLNQEKLQEEYVKAKKWLLDHGFKGHLDELERLYLANWTRDITQATYHKTIESLLKQINNLTK
jgi:hypothetical protein